MRMATCHPERKHRAKGLCTACYCREFARKAAAIKRCTATPEAIEHLRELGRAKRKRFAEADRARASRHYYANHEDNKRRNREYAARVRRENPEIIRERQRQCNYGLKRGEYQRMHDGQHGRCLICDRHRDLVVDHCHVTGVVRGLLCRPCNAFMGVVDQVRGLPARLAAYEAAAVRLVHGGMGHGLGPPIDLDGVLQ